MNKKVALIILDGFGYSKKHQGNAINMAKMPYYNSLLKNYPNTFLRASGKFVGLKNGQMGNSETGHMNIGAGRIVAQDLTNIDNSIFSGDFFENKNLIKFINKIQNQKGALHFVGQLSNGGVHSHMDHLFALLKVAQKQKVKTAYIHIITDGRDVDMFSAKNYINELNKLIKQYDFAKIVSIQGRYYGMDRDAKYQLTQQGYDAIINGIGIETNDVLKYLKQCYNKNISDEYIIPAVVVDDNEKSIKYDNSKDGIIFYNFRKDRTKQLTEAFVQKDFDKFNRPFIVKNLLTMTPYGNFDCDTIFDKNIVSDTLVEVLSKNKKVIGKFSEPTKFPHVTYFLNGGNETPFENEFWFKVPAKKVATFDLAPEMSAKEVAYEVKKQLETTKFDFVMMNFANCDIVGHTGKIDATIQAIEAVDEALSIVIPALQQKGFDVLLTADHGNAEQMVFRNKPCSTHSNNPVRLIYIGDKNVRLTKGTLVDISPTILSLFDIDLPKCYTGKNLIIK